MSTPTPTPTPIPPTKLSIIFAGEAHDGSAPDRALIELLDGTLLAVFVRAMPVRHLGAIFALALKEAELLDFVCMVITPENVREPVPAGWADNLTDKGHVQLYEAAKRQNFLRAASWTERQIVAKQFSGELELKIEEFMLPIVKRMTNLHLSSPKPPALPAAPTPKS